MKPRIPIYKELAALPQRNVTTMALGALDYLVPGQWQNIRSFEAMIVATTGLTHQRQIQLVGERALDIYADPASRHHQALRVFRLVDTMDKVVGGAALANKVGESVKMLSFLEKVTPKADVTQAIDAGLKLVAELVAFCLMYGLPTSAIGEFGRALGRYAREDVMRIAAWIVFDGLIPLGPNFVRKIYDVVMGADASKLTNNKLFRAIASYLPGDTPAEKQGFIANNLAAAADWVHRFVAERGITQESVVARIEQIINYSDAGLDYLAAAIDMSTNYFAHTGTQSVARTLIMQAHRQLLPAGGSVHALS